MTLREATAAFISQHRRTDIASLHYQAETIRLFNVVVVCYRLPGFNQPGKLSGSYYKQDPDLPNDRTKLPIAQHAGKDNADNANFLRPDLGLAY